MLFIIETILLLIIFLIYAQLNGYLKIFSIIFIIGIILNLVEEYRKFKYEVIAEAIKDFHPRIFLVIFTLINGLLSLSIDKGMSIICFSFGIIYFARDFKRDIINEYGVFSRDSNLKWEKIDYYFWGEKHKKITGRGYVEYLELIFYGKNSKLSRKINDEEGKLILRIPIEDREKIENFLERKEIKEKGEKHEK